MPEQTPEQTALDRISKAERWSRAALDFSRLRLKTLPPEIGNLTNLTFLNLSENQITSLPPEIGKLTKLDYLNLKHNQLSTLPSEIGKLTGLFILDLVGNRLTSLPPEIGMLTELNYLYLDSNQLTSLPPEIGRLRSLNQLYLDGNSLTSLPPELGELENLEELGLSGNLLPDALIELANKHTAGALAYIRDQAKAEGEPLFEAKLVLVGEGDVGKTCLLRALQGETFEDQETTKGMEVAREPLNVPHPDGNVEINLNAWDFGGQKEYQVTHQFFFSPRSLYLVVWDPRSGHEKRDVTGWIGRIRLRVGDDATILVVATHTKTGDPPPSVNIDKDELRRKHPEVIAGFFETDAKENHGIDELRKAISQHASKLRGMGEAPPASWQAARAEVLELAKKKKPWISRERFAEIGTAHGMQDDAIGGLLTLMHELGQIVYFGPRTGETKNAPSDGTEDEHLGAVVVLMAEWLAKAICFVLEDQDTKNKSGVLRYDRLKSIWHDDRTKGARYEPNLHSYFLALMEKYDICYRLEDGKSSLVPQLIEQGRPKDLPWYPGQVPAETHQLTLTCELDEVPPGLIPLMIVRTHRFSTANLHWKLGAFLDYGRHGTAHMALVDRELKFTVRGDYPPHFMALLSDSFEVLVEDVWSGLKNRYRLSVPCPVKNEDGVACPGRFNLDVLRKLRRRKRKDGTPVTDVFCDRCAEMSEIADLLDGLSTPGVTGDDRLEKLQTTLDEMRAREESFASSAAQMFRLILKSMHNETASGPGMFTLLPKTGNWVAKARGEQNYSLTLWCEYPDCPHPLCAIGSGGDGDYPIKRSADWVFKVAPYVTWTARVLKVALPIVGAAAGVALGGMTPADLESKLDLMEKCAGALPGGGLETHSPDLEPTGISKRPEGGALREFHDLLTAEVKGRKWGGLRRVLTKSGDYVWLCPTHFDEYEPPLPIVPA